MKLRNLFLVFIVLFFLYSCEEDRDDNKTYGMFLEGAVDITFIDDQNQNLLNPEYSSFSQGLKIYTLIDNTERTIQYYNIDLDNNPFYYIQFNPYHEEMAYKGKDSYTELDGNEYEYEIYHTIPHYIKTDDNIDTLIVEYHIYNESSATAISKLLYNGADIKKDSGNNGLFTVTVEQ